MAFDMLNQDGTPKESTKERVLVPAGPQVARFCQYAEVGIQKRRPYNGKPKKPANTAVLAWEFPTHMHDFGDAGTLPLMISRKVNLFSDPKSNCFKYFMAMRQGVGAEEATNFTQMLGTPIIAKVVHSDDGKYANLPADGISSTQKIDPMAAADAPKEYYDVPELKGTYASFEWDNPTLEAFDALPEWIQKMITSAENYSGSMIAGLLQGRENEKLGIPAGQQAQATPDVPGTVTEADQAAVPPATDDDIPL